MTLAGTLLPALRIDPSRVIVLNLKTEPRPEGAV
jgi:hypothetical protein